MCLVLEIEWILLWMYACMCKYVWRMFFSIRDFSAYFTEINENCYWPLLINQINFVLFDTFVDRVYRSRKYKYIWLYLWSKQMKLILKCIYLLADWPLNRPSPHPPPGAETSTTTNACHCCCWFFLLLLFPNSTSSCLPWIYIHTYERSVTYTNAQTRSGIRRNPNALSLSPREPRVRSGYVSAVVIVVAFYVKFVLKTQSRLLYYIFTKASDISTFAAHVFICVHVYVCMSVCCQ